MVPRLGRLADKELPEHEAEAPDLRADGVGRTSEDLGRTDLVELVP